MSFDRVQMVRVAKRMQQAAGYLELGMAQHALDRLDQAGEFGPFEAEIDLLRGQALGMQHRFRDAAVSIQSALLKFPAPHDKRAWLALSHCYKAAGDTQRALQSLAQARGATSAQGL
jgi:tetratricopeptide (TPR) repeat protein